MDLSEIEELDSDEDGPVVALVWQVLTGIHEIGRTGGAVRAFLWGFGMTDAAIPRSSDS